MCVRTVTQNCVYGTSPSPSPPPPPPRHPLPPPPPSPPFFVLTPLLTPQRRYLAYTRAAIITSLQPFSIPAALSFLFSSLYVPHHYTPPSLPLSPNPQYAVCSRCRARQALANPYRAVPTNTKCLPFLYSLPIPYCHSFC